MDEGTIPLPLEVFNQLHPSISTWTLMKRLVCSLTSIDHMVFRFLIYLGIVLWFLIFVILC
uniref:Uncharacterized protein n=1 Tax=Picea glauca TaxID=3330 RepID=A0A124GNG9_PICGL|nr:hypothetical protein ABT39_MTgene4124 [Picea glauca]QHR92573.1 hypothetical protein Q903MT_gene6619 [Picea sitchensis]